MAFIKLNYTDIISVQETYEELKKKIHNPPCNISGWIEVNEHASISSFKDGYEQRRTELMPRYIQIAHIISIS